MAGCPMGMTHTLHVALHFNPIAASIATPIAISIATFITVSIPYCKSIGILETWALIEEGIRVMWT